MVSPRHIGLALLILIMPSVAMLPQSARAAPRAQAAATKAVEVLPEHLRDEPPPTLWDRRGEDANIAGLQREKLGDNQSFLMQLVRTIVALCGVLFLIWAMARVIGPRLGRVLGGKRSQDMQVTDRLNLDGRNTLVRVSLADGRAYLIACGDHAIKLIDTLPAPAGHPTTPSAPFAQAMGAQKVPKE